MAAPSPFCLNSDLKIASGGGRLPGTDQCDNLFNWYWPTKNIALQQRDANRTKDGKDFFVIHALGDSLKTKIIP